MLSRLTTSLAASRLLATAFCAALAGESWLMNLTLRAVQMFFIALH